jgi:multidrug resistance efflux pump
MLQKVKLQEGVAPPVDTEKKPVDTEKKQLPWQRMIVGTFFVSIGVAAAAVGIASIGYRLTHLVVDGGLINGRIVRQQAPVSGNIKSFYAKPGALVKSGQVLVRIGIERTPQEEQVRLQSERSQEDRIRIQLENTKLQGQVRESTSQLVAARQSLAVLKNQLQSLDSQYKAVQRVDVQLASEALRQKQANVEAAIAKATAARTDYQRYTSLLVQGAVTKQQTDHLRFIWESAEAEVEQARAVLSSAKASLEASKDGVALSPQNSLGSTLADQRSKLLQAIQAQEMLVSNLEAQVASGSQQAKQAESLYKNRPSQGDRTKKPDYYTENQEVSAALTGVVYSTEREQGERVNQSEPILTLLDCNDLWVETVVSANQASSIDTQKPVSVQIAGYSEPIAGEVDLIQPVSSIQAIAERSKLMQVQALMPAIPPTLVGQALARVTVRIPPPPQHMQSQQFCGLGQATSVTFNKKPLTQMKPFKFSTAVH